jgi:hypothetical protein
MAEAAGQPLALAVPLFDFVQNVGRKFDLSEREKVLLNEEFTMEMGRTAVTVPTRWTLSQAFTAAARRMGEGEDQFDRKVEMEELGWKVMGNATTALLEAAALARRN